MLLQVLLPFHLKVQQAKQAQHPDMLCFCGLLACPPQMRVGHDAFFCAYACAWSLRQLAGVHLEAVAAELLHLLPALAHQEQKHLQYDHDVAG